MKRLLIVMATVAALALVAAGISVGFAEEGDGPVSTFLAKVAAKLGVSEDELKTAVDEAYDETVDEAVAGGRLTEEQGERLKERGFDFAPRFGGRLPHVGAPIMEAAAEVLGISADELRTELADGKSLAEVAEAHGMSLDDFEAKLLDQVRSQLDSLVAEGQLTQGQADSMYACTESRIDCIVAAQPGPCGIGRGWGGPRGPGPMNGWFEEPAPESTAHPEGTSL